MQGLPSRLIGRIPDNAVPVLFLSLNPHLIMQTEAEVTDSLCRGEQCDVHVREGGGLNNQDLRQKPDRHPQHFAANGCLKTCLPGHEISVPKFFCVWQQKIRKGWLPHPRSRRPRREDRLRLFRLRRQQMIRASLRAHALPAVFSRPTTTGARRHLLLPGCRKKPVLPPAFFPVLPGISRFRLCAGMIRMIPLKPVLLSGDTASPVKHGSAYAITRPGFCRRGL